MAHKRIAYAVLFFIVGLAPTVISSVIFVCTACADSKQRSRWVSARQVSSPRWPTKRIADAVLFFIVGLAPTVISFVLFVCTGCADSKQRSRWVSSRHVLLRACPKKSQALDGPQVKKALIATITSS